MEHRIPRINRKLYQTPRARFTAGQGGRQPQITGRAGLYQDQYARKDSGRSSRFAKVAIISIAALLIVQSIFQVPFFRISDIQIEGLKYVPIEQVRTFIDNELHRRRFLIFRNDNYFLFARAKMQKRLQDAFYLEVQQMTKKFPNTLIIKVRERISAFVVQTPEGYFTVGTDGKAIADVPKPQPNQILVADERSVRDRSIPLSYLETATTIAEDWQQTVVGATLTAFHLTDDATQVIVSTDKGFQVFLDPKKDIHAQLARLSVYLQDRNFQAPKQYIDLRYDDNVYFKN